MDSLDHVMKELKELNRRLRREQDERVYEECPYFLREGYPIKCLRPCEMKDRYSCSISDSAYVSVIEK